MESHDPPNPSPQNFSPFLFTHSSMVQNPLDTHEGLHIDNIDWVSNLLCGQNNNLLGDTKAVNMECAEKNNGNNKEKRKGSGRLNKKAWRPRFAFQTRSANDVLDDGYRWRKYGQKAVKNNIYPSSCTGAPIAEQLDI